MLLRSRRVISWLGTAAAACALVLALHGLPGVGGLSGELSWLLARSQVPQSRNRATMLLRGAERQGPGEQVRLLRTLLSHDDARVRTGALAAAADILPLFGSRQGIHVGQNDAALAAVLQDWWNRATVEEQIAQLPHSFVAWILVRSPIRTEPLRRRAAPLDAAWMETLSDAERRWLLAASLERSDPLRSLLGELAFRGPAARDVDRALRFLDGLDTAPAAPVTAGAFPSWNWDGEQDHLAWSFAELPAALDDPIAEVRWGAARILAVCGDARGLPVFAEWLRAHPRYGKQAATLMEAVYGPRWRDLCESRRATRDAGPGHGG